MNITCAADIFSLGMTILELATDLDLPRSGDLWHQLRNGHIPPDLVKSLSSELVELIMKMIEPNHLKRSTVNDLIKIPKVKCLILSKNKDISYYLSVIHTMWNRFLLTLWYFVVKPFRTLNLKLHSSNSPQSKSMGQTTSTPKQLMNYNNLMNCVQNESSKSNVSFQFLSFQYSFIINICFQGQNLLENDTFSTNNNSYGQALDDSSSFGDFSGNSNK